MERTRAAASSMARGMPSSRSQISRTVFESRVQLGAKSEATLLRTLDEQGHGRGLFSGAEWQRASSPRLARHRSSAPRGWWRGGGHRRCAQGDDRRAPRLHRSRARSCRGRLSMSRPSRVAAMLSTRFILGLLGDAEDTGDGVGDGGGRANRERVRRARRRLRGPPPVRPRPEGRVESCPHPRHP